MASRKCKCLICPCKSRKRNIVFGDFNRPVLGWDCRKTNIVYVVFCRICRSQAVETVYFGQSSVKLKRRFTNARGALTQFHHPDPDKRRHHSDFTNLIRHFAMDHNISDPLLFQKQLEIAIISEAIPNSITRVDLETNTKDDFREAIRGMRNVRLLNN